MNNENEIVIKSETIKLGQFLKLAGIVLEGGEARDLLNSGEVKVNGQPENRRGRKLKHGDVIECGPSRVVVKVTGSRIG